MAIEDYSFFGEDFPAIDWFDITPSDSTDLTKTPRSLYVGSGGNLVIVSEEGTVVTLNNVPDGTILPIQPKRINSTNTTASDIVGLL